MEASSWGPPRRPAPGTDEWPQAPAAEEKPKLETVKWALSDTDEASGPGAA